MEPGTRRASAHLLANAAALGQHFAAFLDRVAFQHLAATALESFRSCLNDINLAVDAVFRPFDVHGAVVVFFDDESLAGEFFQFLIGHAKMVLVGLGNIDDLDGLHRIIRIDHFDAFGADSTSKQGRATCFERRLVDEEFIGIDGPLNHHFAQPIGPGDEYHVAESRLGIEGEHHAARCDIAANHFLNASGQGNVTVLETLMDTV